MASRRIGASLVMVVLAAGCGVGDGAVAVGGGFQFVSPGGQTEIFYDAGEA